MDVSQPSTQQTGSLRVAGIAWSACGLTLFFILCTLTLDILNDTLDANSYFAIVVVANAVVGGLVASRRPANPVGWLFLGSAVCLSLNGLGGEYAIYLQSGELPFARAAASLTIWTERLGAALLFVFLPLYFPDGSLVSPRWRPVVWLAILFAVVAPVVSAFMPGEAVYGSEIIHPLGVEALRQIRDPFDTVGLVLFWGLILFAVASLVARFRRSGSEERQQLKWFMYAVSAVLVWFVVNWPIEDATPELFPVMDALVIASVPVAAGIAILKYRLFDIDFIINRTLVYGTLTACVVGIYVLVVGYLGALFRTQDSLAISLLAAGVVAVLFASLRDRLQRGVNKLMFGERDEPYKVLSGLGERMEAAPEPESVLPDIAQMVAQSLKLPHVAIRLKRDGEELVEAAKYGKKPTTEALVLPLVYRKETVGELVLSPRVGSGAFSESEVKLLEALARQVGVAAHAVRLSEELQRSRERLVVAREEERRRLRRDLHDGVGPRLATLTLKLETARNKLSHDPEAAALMNALSEQARETVADVRRSVRALRPPSLDELGLVAALREGAAHYEHDGLRVLVVATPQVLPPLPAAAEVACYRIAQEAITNVVRHAGASNCAVRIRLDEEAGILSVEVEDDGRGIGEDDKAGVGLHAMSERAEELGGRCTIAPRSAGGTRVIAELPCKVAEQTNAGAG